MGNPYLAGNFAPVDVETTAVDLPVTGTLPAELHGRYLRNGPNPVALEDPSSYHWFIGTGMVHGVGIADGRANWYRNRYVRSDSLTEMKGWPRTPGPQHHRSPQRQSHSPHPRPPPPAPSRQQPAAENAS